MGASFPRLYACWLRRVTRLKYPHVKAPPLFLFKRGFGHYSNNLMDRLTLNVGGTNVFNGFKPKNSQQHYELVIVNTICSNLSSSSIISDRVYGH